MYNRVKNMNIKINTHLNLELVIQMKKVVDTFIGGTWVDKTTDDLFKGKKILLFSLPGAFTPTCSSQQLPSYDREYLKFIEKG